VEALRAKPVNHNLASLVSVRQMPCHRAELDADRWLAHLKPSRTGHAWFVRAPIFSLVQFHETFSFACWAHPRSVLVRESSSWKRKGFT
jgi:hypothetical protein